MKLSAHLLREVLAIKDYAAKTDGCFEMVGNHIQLKKLILFLQVQCQMRSQEKDGVIFFVCTTIVIRNGKIVWKHGPNRPFFLYNLSSENY